MSGTTQQRTDSDRREPSPFGQALHLARQITDRDQDMTEVEAAVKALDERGQKNIVFRLAGECLRLHVEVPAVFAVARAARMMSVAHSVATIRAGQLGITELTKLGLLEVQIGERDGRRDDRLIPHVGHEALKAAAVALRAEGNTSAAEVLEKHLAFGDERRLFAEARRAAEAAKAPPVAEVPAEEETPPPATPEAVDETPSRKPRSTTTSKAKAKK